MANWLTTGFDRDVRVEEPWLCWEIWPIRFKWKPGAGPNFVAVYDGREHILTTADGLKSAGLIAEGFTAGWFAAGSKRTGTTPREIPCPTAAELSPSKAK
jgi:hypothetical protein